MVACHVKTFNERLCTPQNLTILFSALENEDEVFFGIFYENNLDFDSILKRDIEGSNRRT